MSEPDVPEPLANDPSTVSEEAAHDVALDVVSGGGDPDICTVLPACGPCSLACDLPALAAQYVPPNTCVAIRCTLTTGQTVTVHACNYVESDDAEYLGAASNAVIE